MKKFVFRFIADLRFAIILLFLIIITSIVGTVIEQDQSIEYYKLNYPISQPIFGFLSWNFIVKFNFDHIYTTWIFWSFIFLFGLSLFFCTFLQQFPTLKIARRCQFFRNLNVLNRLQISNRFNTFSIINLITNLKQRNYLIFQQKNIIYCYKGLVGKISPIIVHISMILILMGSFYGSVFGFKAQEIVPKTETFSIQNLLTNQYIQIVPKFFTRVNDFWITYHNFKIYQFYSNISILNLNGNELNQTTLSVNNPLNYNRLNLYQTDWNLIGLRIKNGQNTLSQYPLLKIFDTKNNVWLCWVPHSNFINKGVIFLIDNLQGYITIYNENGNLIYNLELNESWDILHKYTFIDIISSTGIQIKIDPGISIIYSGFFFLIISTAMSYLTYSQIWIVKASTMYIIGGTTNRATFDFELDFLKLTK
mmetsp:Transcript_25844/g.39603  ORF Transcript_25844/g.39603 Transcript_25844/m.39603 type:complete len:421 (+) Transcript_25844:5629-6891(+)